MALNSSNMFKWWGTLWWICTYWRHPHSMESDAFFQLTIFQHQVAAPEVICSWSHSLSVGRCPMSAMLLAKWGISRLFLKQVRLKIGYISIWLVVYLPLWKIWVRQLGWWHSQLNGRIKAMFQTTNQLYYCCRLVDFWLQCFSKPVFLLQPSADSATTLGKIQQKTHGLSKSKQKSNPILEQRCLLHRVHPPIFIANLRYPYKKTS